MIVLIPAYEPDHKLVDLVISIRTAHARQLILLVDDGSGPDYADVFDTCRALGCEVLTHLFNRGKGAALRTGFAHIASVFPGQDVVCADCDGQHTTTDIDKVATVLHEHRTGVVLGSRQFAGDVPTKSRFGNSMTRMVFGMLTGLRLQDTQTGLRGYPGWLLGWLGGIDGDRFEYELEVLLAAKREGLEIWEVPIETIYIAGNESSHFDPIRDSVRVYMPLLRFGLSSIGAFALDTVLFFAFMAVTGNLAVSVVAARTISASVNFVTNRRFVFGSSGDRASSARSYASLVVGLMGANYALMRLLTGPASLPLALAKVLTEVTLFAISYQVQKRLVFRRERSHHVVDGPTASAITTIRPINDLQEVAS